MDPKLSLMLPARPGGWSGAGEGTDPASGLRDGVGVTRCQSLGPYRGGDTPRLRQVAPGRGMVGRAGITGLASSSITRNYKVPGGPGQGGLCQGTPSLPEAPSDMIKDQAGCLPISREEVGLGLTH